MLAIAVLAAGKGTRMKSDLPKVLQKLGGISLLERVLESCKGLRADRRLLIVGHQLETVQESLKSHKDLEFVNQEPQNGTGHAIQQLLPILSNFKGELLVLNGDVPLLKTATIQKLLDQHLKSKAEVTLLSARFSNPKGYGRVFANKHREVSKIIEDRDCTEEQLKNNLTNSGIYCFDWEKLSAILPVLSNQNSQKEVYLTDTISNFNSVLHLEVDDPNEVCGVNDRLQLAQCESLIQNQLRNFWMREGVSFIDPLSCTISEGCRFGNDVVIEPQTHLRGNCKVGNGCHLGPGTLIRDSILGNNVNVINSVISFSNVNNNISIGPFAHLRPETHISSNSKIGNFVEIKKSNIGEGTNISHLSYVGDSEIGEKVNIGAGTITANFDGDQKHKTIIGDYSKTGANCVLVAPIILGKKVTVGAGSTLTKNIPNNSLAIERAKQLIKENWRNSKPSTNQE